MPALAVLAATAALAASSVTAHQQAFKGGAADYIVVGGGTAGCALVAQMCAAIPDKKFVLLERGKPRTKEEELRVRTPACKHSSTTICPGCLCERCN